MSARKPTSEDFEPLVLRGPDGRSTTLVADPDTIDVGEIEIDGETITVTSVQMVPDMAGRVAMSPRAKTLAQASGTHRARAIELARAFAVELRASHSETEVGLILTRNAAETDPNICHSHDVCDANMVMASAWQETFGFMPDAGDKDQAALWNRAWTLAKRSQFSTIPIVIASVVE